MHRYRQIEYRAGATIEIIKCIPKTCRDEMWRTGERRKKTAEEITEANIRQAARKLTRKINANFKPGDWHLTLTYKERASPEEAKARIDQFIKELRREYKKLGFVLKYVNVTEGLARRIHHHIVLNNINSGKVTTADMVRRLWKTTGSPKFVPLYDNGEYKKLAEYLIKETSRTRKALKQEKKDGRAFRQNYSCSRNLINPKPKTEMRTVKKTWEMEPKARPGYYIDQDTLYNGFDLMGYRYQRYVMIKLNPKEEDWQQVG